MKTGLWECCQLEPKAVFLSQMRTTQPEDLKKKKSIFNSHRGGNIQIGMKNIILNISKDFAWMHAWKVFWTGTVYTVALSSETSVLLLAISPFLPLLESFCSRMRFLLQVVAALFIARLSIPSAPLTRLLHRCFTKASFVKAIEICSVPRKSRRREDQRSVSSYKLLKRTSHATSHLCQHHKEHKPPVPLHHLEWQSHCVWHAANKSDCT